MRLVSAADFVLGFAPVVVDSSGCRRRQGEQGRGERGAILGASRRLKQGVEGDDRGAEMGRRGGYRARDRRAQRRRRERPLGRRRRRRRRRSFGAGRFSVTVGVTVRRPRRRRQRRGARANKRRVVSVVSKRRIPLHRATTLDQRRGARTNGDHRRGRNRRSGRDTVVELFEPVQRQPQRRRRRDDVDAVPGVAIPRRTGDSSRGRVERLEELLEERGVVQDSRDGGPFVRVRGGSLHVCRTKKSGRISKRTRRRREPKRRGARVENGRSFFRGTVTRGGERLEAWTGRPRQVPTDDGSRFNVVGQNDGVGSLERPAPPERRPSVPFIALNVRLGQRRGERVGGVRRRHGQRPRRRHPQPRGDSLARALVVFSRARRIILAHPRIVPAGTERESGDGGGDDEVDDPTRRGGIAAGDPAVDQRRGRQRQTLQNARRVRDGGGVVSG
mmetsp:Transcript_10546/g.47494  ORF Transcript_10546/g.47494 Transcript_10546/m.47494 type:complete len:445 (-) Transcript_10546:199-1533(-)